MIVIIDNGESYSDHSIDFFECGDVSPDEALALYNRNRSTYSNGGYIIGHADRIDWREDGATRDIVALLPPSDLLVQLTPQRCEGVAHIAATYGDVDDAKARALSRRVLERCVAMWPHLPVYGPSNEALSRCRMFYQESARKLREWIDTNAPRIAAEPSMGR